MDEIEIRSSLYKTCENQTRPVAALIFLLFGVYGILSLLRALEGVFFSDWFIFMFTAAICFIIWRTIPDLTMQVGNIKLFVALLVIALIVCGAEIFLFGDLLLEQSLYVLRCFTGGGNAGETSVTELMFFLAVLLSFLFSFFEFFLRRHMFLYLLTTALLFLSPMSGIELNTTTVILLFLFQISFFVYQTAGKKRKKIALSGIRQSRLGAKSAAVAAVFVFCLFVAAYPFVSNNIEKFYNMAYQAEGKVRQGVDYLSKEEDKTLNDGKIESGNQFQTGNSCLQLTLDQQPSEILYLRGFTGGDYHDGNWLFADEQETFEQVKRLLNRQESYTLVSAYEDMYFRLNEIKQKEGKVSVAVDNEKEGGRHLEIKHLTKRSQSFYVPYYAAKGTPSGNKQNNESYSYSYYEQKEMDVVWDNVPNNFQWYKQIQDAYIEASKSAYTQISKQDLPRLTKLCESHPLESLNEITAFILYALHSNAEYSLTPGRMPMNEEIVEYFLFKNGKGYCQHFATTAALMYRLYGIPARYVTGYAAYPSDFNLRVNNSNDWRAVITDESAHAWVEIFLEDYGWTPVEVTPTLEGDNITTFPGFDHAVYEQIVKEHEWEKENLIQQSGASLGQGNAGKRKNSFSLQIDDKKLEFIYAIVGISALFLLLALIEFRRYKKLKNVEQAGCRALFYNLQQIFAFSGILTGYDGTEQDFAAQLSEEIAAVSLEDAKLMQRVVIEAAYSEVVTAPEMDDFVRHIYKRIADAVYKKVKWHKKIIFRHWKAFK